MGSLICRCGALRSFAAVADTWSTVLLTTPALSCNVFAGDATFNATRARWLFFEALQLRRCAGVAAITQFGHRRSSVTTSG